MKEIPNFIQKLNNPNDDSVKYAYTCSKCGCNTYSFFNTDSSGWNNSRDDFIMRCVYCNNTS